MIELWIELVFGCGWFEDHLKGGDVAAWGCVWTAGWGWYLGSEIIDLVDGEEDGLFAVAVVVEGPLDHGFDGGA